MRQLVRHLKAALIAAVVLALSAGLAFGAQPESAGWGRGTAALHAGKSVPVQGAEETTETGDEDTEASDEDTEASDEDTEAGSDEDTEEVEDTEEAGEDESAEEAGDEEGGDHCATDPTTLAPEELAAMNHGSVVCWAAQQTEWPAEFANHGAWVKSWAQARKDHGSDAFAAKGHGKGKGKNKGSTGE